MVKDLQNLMSDEEEYQYEGEGNDEQGGEDVEEPSLSTGKIKNTVLRQPLGKGILITKHNNPRKIADFNPFRTGRL